MSLGNKATQILSLLTYLFDSYFIAYVHEMEALGFSCMSMFTLSYQQHPE